MEGNVMIDLTTVKAGDKLHTRQGDVLMVYSNGVLGELCASAWPLSHWSDKGEWINSDAHPLDIIRIEKHEPVVEVYWAAQYAIDNEPIYKITITDGVPSIEKVGE